MEEKEFTGINPLRNEKIIAKFIMRPTTLAGNNPKHVASGGMMESAFHEYVVPQLNNGALKDPLTKEEKEFFEQYLGLGDNALSVYKRKDNYWWNYRVRLYKGDNILDLSVPDDYIKYKILLLNTNLICPDLETLQNRPKATYEYVLVKEGEEAKASRTRVTSKKEAYKEYGKIEDDAKTLRVIIEMMTGRPVARTASLDVLAERIEALIENDSKLFLQIVHDKMLPTKVLLREAISKGVVSDRGGQLYMAEDGKPLCDSGEPTLSVAAAYLNQPKNQELKFLIEAKIKNTGKK